jgi:hypothetical protein
LYYAHVSTNQKDKNFKERHRIYSTKSATEEKGLSKAVVVVEGFPQKEL